MSADPSVDFSGRSYKHRSLTPSQCQAIAAAMGNGANVQELAGQYGVSKRTIYRAASYGREQWVRVRVGDWHAEFVLSDMGPVRCTPWMAVP